MEQFGHFIDGAFTTPSNQWIDSVDPAAGTVWCRFSRGDAQDATAAMDAAERAFESGPWSRMSGAERADCLDQVADALARRWEELVEAEIRDNGKRLTEVRGQFAGLDNWFRPFAEKARHISREPQHNAVPGVQSETTYLPFGPVVAITPWNSPLMILAWKMAPALAAGNTMVVKPSEMASASTLLFAQMVHEAGLPAGVLNVVTGYGHEVGGALVRDQRTRMVTFTGSDLGGGKVAAAAAENVIPATLELGGKSPQVVFGDADPDNAVNGILSGIFLSNGQSCVAGSRLIVQASVKDVLVQKLLARVWTLQLGDPMDPETQIGPLANLPHLEKVRAMIARAVDEGATCLLDGREAGRGRAGFYVGPTIFDDVTPTMQLWREEVFGPVLAITTFDTEAEAVQLANDSAYGLAAGVWTSDSDRGARVARQIRAGTIYINHYRSIDPGASIGGLKRSGYGRELGPDAVKHFLQTRSIWTGTAPVPDPFPA
ncbi:aldehyde dehydrogenase family protein [Ruegeria sp. HKCCD8929]|uniref:aldehyde dehydrogenase family protein n=1 Tax=Ruegeria sp. HKCCD8929 TaxID=2683006 RepID=UPI001488569B|nr:aldehyde dehydrogenase family protein [Ruegeria sp. HKCCD8929]